MADEWWLDHSRRQAFAANLHLATRADTGVDPSQGDCAVQGGEKVPLVIWPISRPSSKTC